MIGYLCPGLMWRRRGPELGATDLGAELRSKNYASSPSARAPVSSLNRRSLHRVLSSAAACHRALATARAPAGHCARPGRRPTGAPPPCTGDPSPAPRTLHGRPVPGRRRPRRTPSLTARSLHRRPSPQRRHRAPQVKF
jgi:hypothetical protein